MNALRPVIGLDLDGTLAEYHQHFIWFAKMWAGQRIDPMYKGEVSMAKHCGMSKTRYRKCKLAYRQSGLKRDMPALGDVRALTRGLRQEGASIWICTTRPYLKVDGVEEDVRIWLRRQGAQYDGLLLGEHKYRELARQVGREKIVAVLDDLPEMVLQAAGLGIPVILHRRPHNILFNWPHWVEDLATAKLQLSALLKHWKVKEG